MAFPVIYDPQIFPPPDEGGGGGGSGTVTSIGATPPINVSPSPITTSGIVGHDASGVTAATYGDATHYPIFTVNATGHISAASTQLGGNPISVSDEGVLLTSAVTSFDFTGAGVTASHVGAAVTVNINVGTATFDWAKAIMAARTYYFQ